jgi:hypothetical protein
MEKLLVVLMGYYLAEKMDGGWVVEMVALMVEYSVVMMV